VSFQELSGKAGQDCGRSRGDWFMRGYYSRDDLVAEKAEAPATVDPV